MLDDIHSYDYGCVYYNVFSIQNLSKLYFLLFFISKELGFFFFCKAFIFFALFPYVLMYIFYAERGELRKEINNL